MSYLVNINGSTSEQVRIYYSPQSNWHDRDHANWFSVYGLTKIKFTLSANNFVIEPDISFTAGFLSMSKCEKPDFDGISIFSGWLGKNGTKAHLSTNTFVCYDEKLIPAIQNLEFEANTHDNTCKLELTMPDLTEIQTDLFYKTSLQSKYLNDLPKWVNIKWKNNS